MNKTELQQMISDVKSIKDLSIHYGKSQTSIRYWLSKFGLKTQWNGFLETKYSDKELLNIANSSSNFTECLTKLCGNHSGGAFYHYKERLNRLHFDFSKFTKTCGRKTTAIKRNIEALQRCPRKRIKRSVLETLLKYNNIQYRCNDCGLSNWNGNRLLLHIHHKDYNSQNNELKNLCYLCPNCHNVRHYDACEKKKILDVYG